MKISSSLGFLCVGLGIGGAILGLVSMAPQAGVEKGSLRVSLDPDPRAIVRVEEGKPFVVPAGRILVVKSLGDANGSSLSAIQLRIDGVTAVTAQMSGPGPATLGFPVTAKPGSTVTVEETFPDPNTLAFAAGYLAAF